SRRAAQRAYAYGIGAESTELPRWERIAPHVAECVPRGKGHRSPDHRTPGTRNAPRVPERRNGLLGSHGTRTSGGGPERKHRVGGTEVVDRWRNGTEDPDRQRNGSSRM